MMKTIQRYISRSLLVITFIALFGLISLFSFFSIVDQLEETGRGGYGISQALLYVALTTPKLAYELFPIAAVIGSMTALGILAKNSELAVLRTSGVSQMDLSALLIRSSLLLVILAALVGEFVAPASEQMAQQLRSIAVNNNQVSLQSTQGIWARDGNTFINIRKVAADDRLEEIFIYEFDHEDNLRNAFTASYGEYINGEWILSDLQQTSISMDGIENKQINTASWSSLFKPEMVEFVLVKPQYMTLWGLYSYIDYLKANAQDTLSYEQAFWTKLVKPFSILGMILLAIPLVNSNSRQTSVGQRIFLGTMLGVLFHICNQTAGHVGIVYSIHPVISVTLPTVALFGVIVYLLKRQA